MIQFNAEIGSGTVLIEYLGNCLSNSAVKHYPDNCLILTAFERVDYDITSQGKDCNSVAEMGILK